MIKITVRGELAKQATPSAHGHRFLVEHIKVPAMVTDLNTVWQALGGEVRSNRLQVSFRKKGGDDSMSQAAGRPSTLSAEDVKRSEEMKFTQPAAETSKFSEVSGESSGRKGQESYFGEDMEQYKHLHDALMIEHVWRSCFVNEKKSKNDRNN